jgi:formyl-CoA transferase
VGPGAGHRRRPFSGEIPRSDRQAPANPVVNYYRTKDGRWINLVLLQADRFWGELCTLLQRPDLIDDPRYADAASRYENKMECVAELDRIFAQRTLAEWKDSLATFKGVWAPAVTPAELHDHVQVEENGYLPEVTDNRGSSLRLVAPPYQFDGQPGRPAGPAPEVGQHTEEVLLDIGLEWDDIAAVREKGALG